MTILVTKQNIIKLNVLVQFTKACKIITPNIIIVKNVIHSVL